MSHLRESWVLEWAIGTLMQHLFLVKSILSAMTTFLFNCFISFSVFSEVALCGKPTGFLMALRTLLLSHFSSVYFQVCGPQVFRMLV